MSSRGAGAGLALIAAAFLAVSAATPLVLPGDLALFAGHPTVDGHTLRIKDVYVGLLEAQLCNTGGDGKCSSGIEQEKLGFRLAVYGELAATGMLILAALALAALTIKKSERRKSAAKLVQLASVFAIAGAGALLIQGPFHEATIPIGIGMPLYATGVLGALISSLIAVRAPPPIKLRVGDRPSQPIASRARAQRPPEPQQAEPFDVQALFADEQRPKDRRREANATRDANANRDARVRQGAPADDPVPRPSHVEPGVAPPPPLRGEAERARANPSSISPPFAAPAAASSMTLPPAPAPGTAPPVIVLPANAPTVIAAPIDPSLDAPPLAATAAMPSPIEPAMDPRVGRPMIAVSASPITQVSLVPPMPDHDMPIGPPTAVMASDGGTDPTQFPRPDTPLAPPPPPPSPPPPLESPRDRRESKAPRPRGESRPPPPPRHRRESQSPPRTQLNGPPPPRPQRDSQFPQAQFQAPLEPPPLLARDGQTMPPPIPSRDAPTMPPPVPSRDGQTIPPPIPSRDGQAMPPPIPSRDGQTMPPPSRAVRASIPMPARAGRTAPGPSQPPLPSPASPRIPPPRSTISMTVPPPPGSVAIPAIPPIPSIPPIPAVPRRAEPDVEAPPATDLGDIDQATISRVPIEITDNASPTSVNYDLPTSDELGATSDDAASPGDNPVDLRAITAGDAVGAPAHLRVTVPFTVPDTAPTEPVDPIEHRRAHATDPNGEAVTVPARSRGRETTPARERPMPKLPISTAPDSLPPPKDSKQPTSGPSPACPQCESPMAWVEEHLRFYCKSCRMYF
jgi:hypothetical protein